MTIATTDSKIRRQSRRKPKPKPHSRSKTAPFLPRGRLNVARFALLALATVTLYLPAIGHSFITLDDREYVTANPHIHNGLGWSTIRWAFSSFEAANWHPLTWLSHALDYQLFGLNPWGHHLDSVLIHALNAGLLFLLMAWITKRAGPSLLVAALFALHPINVESVAWVAERKNVLSTLFFLLALGAYGRYAQKPDWRRYLLVAALFAAGLMAKPMVITLPFVLLLLDYWPLERIPRVAFSKVVLEKIPLLVLSAASAWLTMMAQRSALHSFAELPLGLRIENALVAYGLYLWKTLWPARLAFYPHAAALPSWQWILSALVLIAISALVIIFRNRRYLAVGWCWFLGTLIPVIGLVQVGEYAMADRYAYIPLIGIFVMIAWSFDDIAKGEKIPAAWLAVPAGCALAVLSVVTFRQLAYWRSDYALWSNTLEGADDPLSHNALAMTLMHPESEMTSQDLQDFPSAQNRMDEARRHFERALEVRGPASPLDSGATLADRARTLNNLGNLDRLENRMDESREHAQSALDVYRQLAQQNPDVYLPNVAAALNNLGALNRLQNRLNEARRDDEEAVKLERKLAQQNPSKYLPNLAMNLNELGLINSTQQRMDEAGQDYAEALAIDRQLAGQSPAAYLPDLAMTLTDAARVNAMQNRMNDARPFYEEALHIQRKLAQQNPDVYLPQLAMTLNSLGLVDQIQQRIEPSRAEYHEALSIYRQLASQDEARYRGNVARVEASLQALDRQSPRK